jgi:hypothetical protein
MRSLLLALLLLASFATPPGGPPPRMLYPTAKAKAALAPRANVADDTATISGIVKDQRGDPLARALVTAIPLSELLPVAGPGKPQEAPGDHELNGVKYTYTSEKGEFILKAVKPGEYTLGVQKPLHKPFFSAPFVVVAGETFNAGGITLTPDSGVTGVAGRPEQIVFPNPAASPEELERLIELDSTRGLVCSYIIPLPKMKGWFWITYDIVGGSARQDFAVEEIPCRYDPYDWKSKAQQLRKTFVSIVEIKKKCYLVTH